MSIFDLTHRPSAAVLFQRGDPNDARWGEIVRVAPAEYAAAPVVLLGLPQDEGVRRNQGRIGAAAAPDAIRSCFYRTVAIETPLLFDLGNTRLDDLTTLEDFHARHQAVVEQVLADGKTLIVLGGGNDTSYPDVAALTQAVGHPPLAFNVDAHFDVRADSPRNSGTPYRQLLEEGHLRADQFFEVAYQPFANSLTYHRYLAKKGVTAIALQAVLEQGIAATFAPLLAASAPAVFWGLDMDVVSASDAPGVSAPNAAGLAGQHLCQIAQLAGAEPRTRLFEITEVNPTYDIDNRTCRLAGAAIWHFLAAFQSIQK